MPAIPDRWVLAVLLLLTSAVGLLLVVQRPPVTRKTVFSSLPWFVTGAVLHALPPSVGYPEPVLTMLTTPWVYLVIVSIGGITWTLLTQLTSTHEEGSAIIYYFAVMGLGVLLPPLVLLIVRAGLRSPLGLMVWVAVPVVALVVTYFMVLSLGIWLPDPTYFAGVAGALIIFGVIVDGVTTALAIELGSRVASPALVAATAPLAQLKWITGSFAVIGLLVWLRLASGVAVLVVLELVERTNPVLAERGLKLTTVVSVLLSANTFMLALGEGWFA